MNLLTTILQVPNLVAKSDTTQLTEEVTLQAYELALKGGWIMYPLVFLLVLGIYIFFERYFAIKKASKRDANFMDRIKDKIYSGKIEEARNLCEVTDSPVSRMAAKGLSRLGRPLNDINTAVENIGNLEIARLECGLPIIASISGGAPMIGFLGTVIGMIRAFYDMASAGNNIDVTLLSSGIYTAMVTTVAGLIVGIIAYFAYNYLVSRIERVVYNLESETMVFLDLLNEPAE
jgi:biopolymer transport protein ExbB